MSLSHRCLSFVLSVAVLAASGLGLHSGMVLLVDGHGHLTVAMPHLLHAHAHQRGADDHPSDVGTGGDHQDLHHLIDVTMDSHPGTGNGDRGASSADTTSAGSPPVDLYLPAELAPTVHTISHSSPRATDPGGDAARVEIASLRAIVLLV
jgi:hypothetical protein